MKRRDARRLLSSLEEIFEATRDKSTQPPYPPDEKTGAISLPPEVAMELRRLVGSGQKIEAVKRTAKLTGAGLKASKAYVDNLPKPMK
ncbi:MAG: hypothetical protein M3494_05595 [Actinomycetota bacterium]|jgi:ribosomal protein L7/L12|nr:hypothetical protein [Rubrobacter sp.]MDQ3507472.1 hypothetical protein [Actinomycetota bacterium]